MRDDFQNFNLMKVDEGEEQEAALPSITQRVYSPPPSISRALTQRGEQQKSASGCHRTGSPYSYPRSGIFFGVCFSFFVRFLIV